jgi:uncharacterized protein YkwD
MLLSALAPLVLAAALQGGHRPAARPVPPEARPEAVRLELLHRLNEQRAAAGAPPLRPSAALDRAAQQHVAELAARGSLRGEHRPQDAMEQRLVAAGYDAHEWVENILAGPAGAAELIAAWRDDDSDHTWSRLLDPEYSDLGIGVGDLDGQPLYSILFAQSQEESFARHTAPLRDLPRMRAELLAGINAERHKAGRRPLAENARLDAAAQRHADDMLARSFFAHRNPDGTTVRERSRAAGYYWQAIGENLAEGQDTVAEAILEWMRSAGHRENILNRDYAETGIGLALGRDRETGVYRILWVQTFGLAR